MQKKLCLQMHEAKKKIIFKEKSISLKTKKKLNETFCVLLFAFFSALLNYVTFGVFMT